MPAWLDDLLFKFRASIANVFILHFNVVDYTDARGRRVRDEVANAFAKHGRTVAFYNLADGITFPDANARDNFFQTVLGAPDDGAALPSEPAKAFRLLDRLLHSGHGAVIIDQAETVIPATDMPDRDEARTLVHLRNWASDPRLFPGRSKGDARAGGPVVLLTQHLSRIHGALRAATAKTESIQVPLPGEEERAAYVAAMLQKRRLQSDLTPQELAALTAGLSHLLIEDIGLRAEASGQPINLQFVRERKQSLVRAEYGDVLEFIEPRHGFSALGGLAEAKAYCLRSIRGPLRAGDVRRAPMGVLFTGPSGTGKSAFFSALVHEAGVGGVKLNPGRILGPYVGNSEQNLEKALLGIESLGRCLVFVDEIDQTLQRGNGMDNGVDQRLFARMLDWMSDASHRGRIVVIAATNRPDLMDPALKRAGRFDRKVPFLIPGPDQQVEILQALARRHEVEGTPDWRAVTAQTAGFTGAELESLVLKAWDLADGGPVSTETLMDARARMRPATGAVEFMTLLALRECEDRDLVPPAYQELWADQVEIVRRIERTRIAAHLQ